MAQSSEPVLFTCEVVSSILATRTYLKRVGQLSAKNRGFSPAAPVSFHREVDGEGLNKNTCSWESKNDEATSRHFINISLLMHYTKYCHVG